MKYLAIVFFFLTTLMTAQEKMEPITIPIGSLDIVDKNVGGKLKYSSFSSGNALVGKYSISVRERKEDRKDYDGEGNDIPNNGVFSGYRTHYNQLGYFVEGYKNGLWKTTYKNKSVKTENWRIGLLIGRYRVYDNEGEILYKTTFGTDGNGIYKDFYFETGKLKKEGNYKNGKKEGEWCQYDEKGEQTSNLHYSKGVPIEKE